MKRAHPFVINIEESKIIHLLQHHVARIVQNIRARMIADRAEKALEGRAVVQILAGMELETHIHSRIVKSIQNRQPAPTQFLEYLID